MNWRQHQLLVVWQPRAMRAKIGQKVRNFFLATLLCLTSIPPPPPSPNTPFFWFTSVSLQLLFETHFCISNFSASLLHFAEPLVSVSIISAVFRCSIHNHNLRLRLRRWVSLTLCFFGTSFGATSALIATTEPKQSLSLGAHTLY